MAKSVIDFPMNLDKNKPKSYPQRRFSTGNANIRISEPKPIPNYLRASIGSCHDFCKYGIRRNSPPESRSPVNPKQDKNVKVVEEVRSKTNLRGDVISKSNELVPTSSRQRPSELKPNPLARSDRSAVKQANRTFSKSTTNARTSRSDAGKGASVSKETKKSSSLPPTRSSVKIPSVKTSKGKSTPEMKKSVENSETCTKTSDDNVPEKIIHVIEPNDENRNKDLAQDSIHCTRSNSSPKQKQEMDSPTKRSKAVKTERVVIKKENDSSPRKLKIKKREKVLETENRDAAAVKKNLRRAVSDRELRSEQNVSTRGALRHQAIEPKNADPNLMNIVIEETASKLIKMRNSKVKALVGAFETLINTHDSESSTTYPMSE